jgi:hypothetical protein
MLYVSVKGKSMVPNLSNMAAYDVADVLFPPGEEKKNRYHIYFYTGAGERYDWEFETAQERDIAYNNLPHTPIGEKK